LLLHCYCKHNGMNRNEIQERNESAFRTGDKTLDNTPALVMDSISANFESVGWGFESLRGRLKAHSK
jgi:hypothetical protein